MTELLFDPMFRVPFITGLVLAPLTALLGTLLRLRSEWLAALAYSQLAAAGGIIAALFHLPLLVGALVVAALVAAYKGLFSRIGNDHFALLILFGWTLTMAAASYSAHGDMVGRALLDGQLYFISTNHLIASLVLLVLAVPLLRWLMPRLLRTSFFPDYYLANGAGGRRHTLLFDLFVVASIAITATALGVMSTFALVFIPSWVAWKIAVGWNQVMLISVVIALVCYVLAYVLAIAIDQAFGPVLTGLLVLSASLRLLPAISRNSLAQ